MLMAGSVFGWVALGGLVIAGLFVASQPALLSSILGSMPMMMMPMMMQTGNCMAAVTGGTRAVNLMGAMPAVSSMGVTERIAAGLPGAPRVILSQNWPVSAGILQLGPGATRGPISHPSNKILYCYSGMAVITMVMGNTPQAFTMGVGDMAFIPKRTAHSITGVSDSAFVEGWDSIAVQTNNAAQIPHVAMPSSTSGFKVNLGAATPDVLNYGGSDTTGNTTRLHILTGLAIFSIFLKPNGVREPHNHPNASELHYVLSGQMGYEVLEPGTGTVLDQGNIGPGSFFTAPPGYLHWFWNTGGSNDLHVIAVFSNELPGDKGYTTAYQAIYLKTTPGCATLADYLKPGTKV